MKKNSVKGEEKVPFAQRHPGINFMIGLVSLGILVFTVILLIWFIFSCLGNGIEHLVDFLKKFVSTTDKVIIVAMITGMVSIVGVVFTSVIAKIIDYRYNVKKYLYDKRETPYEQFLSIIYTIMEDTKKPVNEQMTESDKFRMMSEFSKGLTLWGSNKVVKKWLRYRKASLEDMSPENSLLLLEDIIYEIRKDVGQRKRLGKGDMLSIFINDIENIIKK
ncbi:MAG: hypothetical protein K2O16_08675 [Lachnospiraceae bacterium]|nr:hypothetical protein [Lachnospiraceae bacterium]